MILGGVIIEEKEVGDQVFLRLKNRPLDQDYKPQRPLSLDGSEAGYYWVMISRSDLPEQYRDWARVTVVGEVAGNRPSAADSSGALEPVLAAHVLTWMGRCRSEYRRVDRASESQSDDICAERSQRRI